MDSSFDIFQIYCQYCDITSRAIADNGDGFEREDESQNVRISREELSQLLKVVESKVNTRVSILEELYKLMSRMDLMADFSEFARFYDFVFFIYRENGQRNITVSRAVMAWRLVLAGRFRLLNQWCKFVEENQRHNISEDTWRQVLAFSRCVHENLEGYDPEGAWPVLIDDFVEYMYRTNGSSSLICNCGDMEPQQCEDALYACAAGLRIAPGSKRKVCDNLRKGEEEYAEGLTNTSKRRHFSCPCSVEGCLSRGFAGLLSSQSCLQFDRDRRVSYT